MGEMQSIAPGMIKSDNNDYNVRHLVLKQVDRITYLMSIDLAHTTGISAIFRARAYGAKSGLMSLEALISPFLEADSEYVEKSLRIRGILLNLENNGRISAQDFYYWNYLNEWLSLLIKELSKLGYFPNKMEEINFD
jgi:hypothetical protein